MAIGPDPFNFLGPRTLAHVYVPRAMEKPVARSWTYTGLRNDAEVVAQLWRFKFQGVARVGRWIDTLEQVAIRAINFAERVERLTYPSRWERIANDSMNPPG